MQTTSNLAFSGEAGAVESAMTNEKKVEELVQEPEVDERLKLIKELKTFTLPSGLNILPDAEKNQEKVAIWKVNHPLPKLFFLGMLAGFWIAAPAVLALTIAGGLPADIRDLWPSIPKLIIGSFLPAAIFLIILFGGELFSGNCMIMTVGFFSGRITVKEILYNMWWVLVSNFVGCVFYIYFFMELCEFFHKEPWKSYVVSVAVAKVNLEYHVAFLRSIPANAFVCTSVVLGSLSHDMCGKLAALWFPIMIFSVVGYEHAIANMAFVPAGLFSGADSQVDYGHWLGTNLLLVIIGNAIGGGLFVGGTMWYLYSWTTHYGRVTSISKSSSLQQLRRGRSNLKSWIVWENS